MQKQKFFLIGMAVLLGASLVLTGCPTDTEEKTVTVTQTVPEMIHLDVAAATEAALKTELAKTGDLSIGFTGSSIPLTDSLTIPDGKVVYILPSAGLSLSTYDLTVDGIVYVGGTLTAGGTGVVKIPGTGRVGVVKGGTLSVKNALSVNNGETSGTATVLGTKATFAAEATLAISEAPADVAAIGTLWGLLPRGLLDLSSVTLPSIKVSQLVALPGISETKRLKATATATEDTAYTGTITIPKGADITAESSDTLANITGLIVNGKFATADGTLVAVTALTVNGALSAPDATFDALISGTGTGALLAGAVGATVAPHIIESDLKSATLASTTITDENLVIPASTIRNFTGAAAPSGDVTVNGTLYVSSSLTIVAGKELAIAGTVNLVAGSGSLVLTTAASGTTGGAKLTGAGKLTAQDTEISGGAGGWLAVLDSGSAAETVTIASTATDGQASITGSTTATTASLAGGADATITQKAGTSGNSLTIAANTTIALGGDGTAVGSIVLKGAASDPGKLVFANAGSSDVGSSLVTTAATGANTKVTGTVSAPSTGTALIWHAANATTGGKWSKVGASNSTNGLTGGGADVDVTLSGATTVTAS